MYMDGSILESQKHGIIVCVPKTRKPTSTENYRPLTLTNSDFNLLSRIIANRLRPWFNDLLHRSQYCGVHGNNILGEFAAVWETIAHAKLTNTPTRILSVNFKQAFDNLAHSYLCAMPENHGFSQNFRRRIQRIYEQVTFLVHVSGYIAKPLPINCSIRQGCALIMLLFTLCFDPLLRTLHDRLTEFSPGSHKYRAAVLAYADDITIILRSTNDEAILQEEIKYEATSGAKLNSDK
jgi:hypothetical protein